MDGSPDLSTELEPLRAALLAEAQRDADATFAEARARVQAIGVEADAACGRILSRARAEGETAAARRTAHRLVEAKRAARGNVLKAQRAAYDALFDAVLAELRTVREREEYASLENRLANAAASALGEDAVVERDPGGRGGVSARLDDRYVDLTFPVLVRRYIATLGREVSRLWE